MSCTWEGQSCLGGWSEVRRPSEEPRKIRRDGIENFGGRVASGNSLGIGGKDGNVFRPIRRQLSFLNLVELCRKLGEFFPVLFEFFLPLLARFAASPSNAGFEVLIHSVGYQEFGVGRPAVRLLRELDLFVAKRFAVCGAGVLTMRRTIADVTIYDYDGRSARRAGGVPQRVIDTIESG